MTDQTSKVEFCLKHMVYIHRVVKVPDTCPEPKPVIVGQCIDVRLLKPNV